MKFGIFYELQIPRPWGETSERDVLANALTQIETADRLGFDYAWLPSLRLCHDLDRRPTEGLLQCAHHAPILTRPRH